jgi:hypothetical protein
MLAQPVVESAAQILHRSDALVTAELNKVVIIFWRKQPTKETFALQKSALDTMVRRHGSGVGVICVVEPTCDPPEDELRKASAKMVKDHGERIMCVGCVIEGSGFRAAITRTALSGITFMIRTPAPIKFFVTPKEAAAWVASRMTVERPERFADDVERVRGYFITNK